MNQYWIMLLIAAGLEIVWAIGLKYTEGFTRLWPSIGTILAMAASMYLLPGPPRACRSGRHMRFGPGSGPSGRRSWECSC